ncbi:MAG TPA: LLM class F420-dependent oxidoreductase [Dermatophilaceae bacterium]
MELRVFIEPQQGASYADQLTVARKAEEVGFPAFFRSDHLLVMGDGDGLPGPTDTWTTLAGLARDTSTIRLGTLVTSATFRHPGLLAVQVAQVDEMSGGRVELGLGAGWSEREHAAYGVPFPESAGERFDRLEEQLAIITGLWETAAGERFTHEGKHYTLVDSPALPKPVQAPLPIVIGGKGRRRTPELAARYASDFNLPFVSVQESAGLFANVRRVAGAAGRDLSTLTLSNALAVCVGRDESQARRRAAAIGRDLDGLRHDGLAGSPDEIVDKIGQYAAGGTSRIYLQVLDLHDLDHLELIASQVMNQLSR